MIVYPDNWERAGQPIELKEIEETILQILSEISCNCLSLSGGIDSSLLLYYMTKIWGNNVKAYTVALSDKHPDFLFSKKIASLFNIDWQCYFPMGVVKKKKGVYKIFYKWLEEKGVKEIIAGDGVDEFMGGYYDHTTNPTEETYYGHLKRLKEKHLIPLNFDSGNIGVYLPYIDPKLIYLLSQIPISKKFDGRKRKKIMVKLAKDKLPEDMLHRWKYGFCDALRIKENKSGS